MCESGRKLSETSSDRKGITACTATTFDVMLPCESIAPFGSPVVPDV